MRKTDNAGGAILEPGEFQWFGCPVSKQGDPVLYRVRSYLAVVAEKGQQPTFPGKVWLPQHWIAGGDWARVLVWNDTAAELAVFVAIKLELGGPAAGAAAGRVMPAVLHPCEAPGEPS